MELKHITHSHVVSARTGYCFEVEKDDLVRFTDLEGHQPIDFWAFDKADVKEFLSVEHTRVWNLSLDVHPGESAVTTKRRPIVTIVEDNSPGQHDMLLAACDLTRYQLLGVEDYHVNCQDNLHAALKTKGIELGFTPQPWNLFTNFPVTPDRKIVITAPDTKAGDNIVFRAEMDAYIAISACPQDQNQTCGGAPSDVMVEVGSA